ncbi:helix-turn-helix transcriptional regulator [Streptomyces sp. NBC_01476]|uniref:helix-turn-helix transcriptional regulator n=1 Tax=Streptomyces sp. NBC_01476 TaxID=2903881 RepID=UPI002E333CF8|nr:helix-turn-helix transcriptional regulator [Streptomyces sp. NBC_01476]
MNPPDLAEFLRRCRSRLAPADVGLTGGARRRSPGLRREEVARLAGMSADYYTRLEQGRASRPSRQMLTAMARALRLTAGERDRLFVLADEEPPREAGGCGHVRPGLLLVLDRLHDTPAEVVTELGDVLAQNTMAAALFGDISARAPRDRNLVRRLFTDPDALALIPAADHEALAREHVAHLRELLAARPGDPRPAALVAELLAASALFARLWDGPGALPRPCDVRRLRHPVVGELVLDREVLLSSGHDQRLIVHSARPGTASYERLRLLRVVGLQDLTAS